MFIFVSPTTNHVCKTSKHKLAYFLLNFDCYVPKPQSNIAQCKVACKLIYKLFFVLQSNYGREQGAGGTGTIDMTSKKKFQDFSDPLPPFLPYMVCYSHVHVFFHGGTDNKLEASPACPCPVCKSQLGLRWHDNE